MFIFLRILALNYASRLRIYKTLVVANCLFVALFMNLGCASRDLDLIEDPFEIIESLQSKYTTGPIVLSAGDSLLSYFIQSPEPYLLTGYYQPLICGSLERSKIFKYPIHYYHEDLTQYDRAFLSTHEKRVLMWTDDPIALFFVHIQGSAIVAFLDPGYNEEVSYRTAKKYEKILVEQCNRFNKIARLKFSGRNILPYSSIAKAAIDSNLIDRKQVTKETLEELLARMPPQKRDALLGINKSYIFFDLEEINEVNPRGSANITLKPHISLAADLESFSYDEPVIIELDNQLILGFVHDTGAAIKRNRLDLFIGTGPKAGKIAGDLKKKVIVYRLKSQRKANIRAVAQERNQ